MEDTAIEDTTTTTSSPKDDPSPSSPKSETRPAMKDPSSPETATTAKSYDGVYYGDSEDELENLKIGTKEQPIIVESLEDLNYFDSFSHASELYGGDIINNNNSNEHDGVYYGDSDEDNDDDNEEDDSKVSRNRMATPLHKMVIEEENVEEEHVIEEEDSPDTENSSSNATDESAEAVETATDRYCLLASVLSVVICNGCLDEVQLSSSIDAVLHEENPAESSSSSTRVPTHHPLGERRESEDHFPILDLPSSDVAIAISAEEDPDQTSRVGAKWKKRVTTLKQKRKEQQEEQQQDENQQPEENSNNSSIPNDILALEETVSLEFDKLYTSWQQEKALAFDANSSSEGEELAGDNDGNSSSEGDDMHTCCDEDDENQLAATPSIPEDSENIVETPTQVRTFCVGTASSSVASGNSKNNEDCEVDEDENMQSCATSTTPEDEENIVKTSSSVASGHSKSDEDCVVDEDEDMQSCATSTTPEDEENIVTASSSVASGNSKSDEDCVVDEDEDMHSCNSQEATEESDAKPQNEATSMDDMYTCNSGGPGNLRVGETLSAPVGDEYELYSIDHDMFAIVKEQQPEKDDDNLVASTTTGCKVGFAFEDVSSLFSVIAKREEQEQDLSSLTFTERNDSKKYVQLNIIEGDRVGEVRWEEDVDIDIDNCSDTSYITAADEEELHEETKDNLPRESRSVKSENGNSFQVLGQTKATADLLEYFRTNYASTETALADTTDTVKGRMLGFLKNGNTSTPLTSALAKDVLEEANHDMLLEQKEQLEEELEESPLETAEDRTKNTTAPDKGLNDDASSGTLATEIHETVCIETIIQDSTDSLYSSSPEDVQSSLQSQVEVVVYGHDSFVKQDDKAAAAASQVWCCDWFGGAFNIYGAKTAKGTNEACLASLDSTEVSSHASWLDGKLKKKSQQEPPPQPWYVMPQVDSCTELEDLLLREEIASSPSHECGVDRLAILQEFHQFQSERQGSKQQREAANASSNNNRVMEIVLFPEEREPQL